MEIYRDVEGSQLSSFSDRNSGTVKGKTFQPTPSRQTSAVPRHALGNVSNIKFQAINKQNSKSISETPLRQCVKSSSNVDKQQIPALKQTLKSVSCARVSSPVKVPGDSYPEIEIMHVTKDEPDDFESVWPRAQRISTYVSEFCSWRPSYPPLASNNDIEGSDEEWSRPTLELILRPYNQTPISGIDGTVEAIETTDVSQFMRELDELSSLPSEEELW
ncbi:PREDICTED: uncharacterized protein LOC106807385 [Priapulus caudatus]|uniref:Uncharacterized protein LOC106807385 n=1 Tax=Priapulus caudatus TaxID=37621 RepID=A0ABM1DZ16_PRICU|nr:PREDICTED: uncharacterized protein LOC106807385 [Priapulus caudatus]